MIWTIKIRENEEPREIPASCLVAACARMKLIATIGMFVNTLELVSAFSEHFDCSISLNSI